jgi:hypothetical protein
MFPPTESTRSTFEECLRACADAEQACVEALRHSAERGDLYADPEHLRLLMDCGRVCARTAQILRHGWWEQEDACRECVELCEACAADCIGFDDGPLRACAERCRRCARACRTLMDTGATVPDEADEDDAA